MTVPVMRRVSLRNLAAHKVRLALTVLSVVLGTAFIAGSFVFTDTLGHTFHGLFGDVAKGVDVQVTGPDENGSGVPVTDLSRFEAVPGVRAVDPQASAEIVLLGANGKPVQSGGAPTKGVSYSDPASTVGPGYRFIVGRPPAQDAEIALNKGAMKLAGLTLGDHTKVLVPSRDVLPVTVVGVYDTKSDTGGYVGALFARAQAMRLFTDGSHVHSVNVAGAGVRPDVLKARLERAVPGLTYQTGTEVTKKTQNSVTTAISFINYFLLAFGAIALLVGTFIIYNTFSMLIAQRLRELALLRAVGASRRQVNRSVLLEAVVVGLTGSVLGIGSGVGLAYGLRGLLNAFHLGLPAGPLQLRPRTVLVALLVGVVVTVLSAYQPARRAAGTPPVAAMRGDAASSPGSLRRRTIAGSALGLLGTATLIRGATMPAGGGAAGVVGIGALLAIVGLLLGAPALSRPVVGLVGPAISAPFGAVGRLARTNAVRNPRRTAATAFALTLGSTLVSAIAVFGASAKQEVGRVVDNNVTADYVLSGPDAVGVPYPASQVVAGVAGVQETVAIYPVLVKIGGSIAPGSGADGPLHQLVHLPLISGTDRVTGNGLLVAQDYATSHHWALGSRVAATTPDGRPAPLTVTGIYRSNPLFDHWVTSGDYYRQVTPRSRWQDDAVLVKAAPGTDLARLRAGLTAATDRYLVVKVQDKQQFKGEQANTIDQLLAILYALLALAIVIAVLGIINTLALAVVERRREIGMLRAVGMLRAQVRRAIYLESTLIALFGAITGVSFGLTLGALFVRTLRNQGLAHVALPVGQSVAMLVMAAVVGVLAALWPAVQAARTRPLDAIADL